MSLIPALVATAAIAEDDLADLRRQVQDLQQRVAKLSGNETDHWLTQQREHEVRALVHEVLADADSRASLLQSGLTAGYDRGFFVGSGDGNFRLRIGGRMQMRYIYNFQSTPPPDGDRHRSGFEHRRMQIAFDGHIIDPSWGYKIQGDFSRSTGTFTLLDGYLDKMFDNGMAVRVGQFRHQFLKEDGTSSGRQLAVERSLVNTRFAQNRTQGIELRGSAGDRGRWFAAFTEGIPSTLGDAGRGRNTPFNARTTEYALTGRFEFLAVGDAPGAWRQFREFTSWAGEPFGLLLGAAGHWQRDEYGTDDDVTEMLRWTVDAMAKFGGAGAFVAFIGNHESTRGGGSVDQYGLVAQASVFVVPDTWEAFVRYEWGDADAQGSDLSVLTVGFNRYFHWHDLKWTTDIGYGFKEVSPFWATASAGYRGDAPGEDGQLVIRSQLQLNF